ncbi:MAG: hypothetical protein P8Z69_09700, partial [Acidihalobacter sp.]
RRCLASPVCSNSSDTDEPRLHMPSDNRTLLGAASVHSIPEALEKPAAQRKHKELPKGPDAPQTP